MKINHYLTLLSASFCFIMLLLAGDLSYASPYEKSGENDVLALIGSQKITVKELNERLEKLPPDSKFIYVTEQGREQFLREMVRAEVFSREAREIGLNKVKDFRERITKIENALL